MRTRARLRRWAEGIRRDLTVVWLAARDRRVKWYVKLLAAAVAGYALSPIDLIPDFIPLLGYLDELILVPLGLLLALRMIPPDVLAKLRAAATEMAGAPGGRLAASVIVALWIALAIGAALAAMRWLDG